MATITFDTDNMSDLDRRVAAALAGVDLVDPPTVVTEPAPTPKKATPKTEPAATPKKATPKPEPKPEPEGPTLQDVVSRATEVVGKGKVAEVRAALEKLGASRVNELKADQYASFISELEGA